MMSSNDYGNYHYYPDYYNPYTNQQIQSSAPVIYRSSCRFETNYQNQQKNDCYYGYYNNQVPHQPQFSADTSPSSSSAPSSSVADDDSSSLKTCPHCPYTTRTNGKLDQHVRRLHTFRPNATSKVYKCAECDYTTLKPVEIRAHCRLHQQRYNNSAVNKQQTTNNSAFKRRATCPLCNYSSTTAHVRQHTRRYHRNSSTSVLVSNNNF